MGWPRLITVSGPFASQDDLKWPDSLIIRGSAADGPMQCADWIRSWSGSTCEATGIRPTPAVAQAGELNPMLRMGCSPPRKGCPHCVGRKFPAGGDGCVWSSNCQDMEEGGPITRRLAATVTALVLAALLAGCSNDSADPGTTSASASSAAPPTPSVAAVSTTSITSTVPLPEAGSSPQATSNPWPAGLTRAQVSDAKAALDVYGRYQALVGVAGANPAKDWTEEVSSVATALAESQLVEALTQTAVRGQRTTGSAQISPIVTRTQPSLVMIQDCVDSSNSDFLDSEGKSIKAPDASGTYYRHPATAQVVQVQDGSWRVAIASDDWSTRC